MTEQEIMQEWLEPSTLYVSVCCTAYNNEAFIVEALDSILSQKTTFPFEIIVRDDASTDNTASIIQTYQEKFPNIIKPILEKENQYSQGVKALPVTFAQAQGNYIAICQADDYWNDTTKLQQQIDFLEANPDYVITYHDCEAVTKDGIIHDDLGGAKRDLTAQELQRCTPIYTLTACFRNVIQNYPKEHYSARIADLFLWSMLGAYGKGKYLENIKYARYRIHAGGIFSQKTKKERYEMAMSTDATLFIYYSHRSNKELSQYFKHKLVNDWILSENTRILLKDIAFYHWERFKRKVKGKFNKYIKKNLDRFN